MRILSLLVLFFLCTLRQVSAQAPHLYYLCIGNTDYADVSAYSRVPVCKNSAKRMADILGKYGTGKTLLSEEGKYLSKDQVLAGVEDLLNKAITDKLALIVVYYSGHGLSDNLDNLYLVPGDIDGQMKLTQYTVMDKFIGVHEIQAIFNDYLNENYQVGNAFYAAYTQGMINSLQKVSHAKADHSMDSLENTAAFKKMINQVPKMIIMADCCYEHFFKDPRILSKYEGSLMSLYTRHKYVIGTRNDKKGRDDDDDDDDEDDNNPYLQTPDFVAHGLWKGERKFYGAMGNKVLYSATIGQLTETFEDPYGLTKAVSPICRRMSLYFQSGRTQFVTADMLTRIVAKDFDSKTPPIQVENSKNEHSLTVEQIGGAGWMPEMFNNNINDKKN